jgi:ABC-2 type transport system permease protein
VARDAPVGRYGKPQFVTYFLATFVVRQLAGSWVFWDMNFEIRDGTLNMRLLRPVHPLVGYAATSVASLPMRVLVSLPMALGALAVAGAAGITHDPFLWLLWIASIAGAWALTLLVNLLVGCAAFFVESSIKVMDAWLVLFFVFSGYLIPIELFPDRVRHVLDWLPFRFQLGLPVEILTGVHDRPGAAALLLDQWAWVAVAFAATALAWRSGLRRYAAYGG